MLALRIGDGIHRLSHPRRFGDACPIFPPTYEGDDDTLASHGLYS